MAVFIFSILMPLVNFRGRTFELYLIVFLASSWAIISLSTESTIDFYNYQFSLSKCGSVWSLKDYVGRDVFAHLTSIGLNSVLSCENSFFVVRSIHLFLLLSAFFVFLRSFGSDLERIQYVFFSFIICMVWVALGWWRQGASIFFLYAALLSVKECPFKSILLGLFACLLHKAAVPYFIVLGIILMPRNDEIPAYLSHLILAGVFSAIAPAYHALSRFFGVHYYVDEISFSVLGRILIIVLTLGLVVFSKSTIGSLTHWVKGCGKSISILRSWVILASIFSLLAFLLEPARIAFDRFAFQLVPLSFAIIIFWGNNLILKGKLGQQLSFLMGILAPIGSGILLIVWLLYSPNSSNLTNLRFLSWP